MILMPQSRGSPTHSYLHDLAQWCSLETKIKIHSAKHIEGSSMGLPSVYALLNFSVPIVDAEKKQNQIRFVRQNVFQGHDVVC